MPSVLLLTFLFLVYCVSWLSLKLQALQSPKSYNQSAKKLHFLSEVLYHICSLLKEFSFLSLSLLRTHTYTQKKSLYYHHLQYPLGHIHPLTEDDLAVHLLTVSPQTSPDSSQIIYLLPPIFSDVLITFCSRAYVHCFFWKKGSKVRQATACFLKITFLASHQPW